MKVWMLLLILSFSYGALASEFKHIKLNPDFEAYLTQTPAKSNLSVNSKSLASPMRSALTVDYRSIILGVSDKNNLNPVPIDGQDSLLYEEIRRHLEGRQNQIGLAEVQNINRINTQFNLGSSNFSGFSWQKPFGVVQVYADRQVIPNIFDENWLVTDTFTFEVEASTFLEKLADAGLSNMSPTDIKAFAGITFKRVYTYWHYANSYQEGLQADFSRLFLPFLAFNEQGMNRMGQKEIMKREDLWTAGVGGLISTPPLYNVSFGAGALAQYSYKNSTSVEANPSRNEQFLVGVKAEDTRLAGVTLELQLDFFKLIKFSLLRYDLNYEYAKGKEFNLGFTSEEWAKVKGDDALNKEFKDILKGTSGVKRLEPFVVRLDETESSSTEQRGSLLLWGKMQKQKTEQTRVIKDDLVKVFYKSYAQNVKVVQNFLSRIFSAIIYKILKFPVGVKNAAIYSQQVVLEYEATHPQAVDPKVIRLDNTEQFSFVITQYYHSNRTDRWIDRIFKNDLIWFVDNYTTLPKNYKTDIRNETLRGPMLIESTLRVDHAGLNHLLATPDDLIFGYIGGVCGSKMIAKWTKEKEREKLLKKQQTGKEKCVKDMGKDYLSFKEDFVVHQHKPSIAKFKSFLTQYYKKCNGIPDLTNLFGAQNVFINGKLEAKTSMGFPFNTVFSTGQFRGLGVIDNFKRSETSRAPASIVSE